MQRSERLQLSGTLFSEVCSVEDALPLDICLYQLEGCRVSELMNGQIQIVQQ